MPVPSRPATAAGSSRRLALRSARVLLLAAILLMLVACSSNPTGGGSTLLHYQRVWPDGRIEQQTIYTDGRIEMKHGETLERITLATADLARLQDALKQPIPTGSPDDSPRRTLELADGTVVDAPVPVPGSVTQLLEALLNTHTLG